jgi:hypothetical protein
MENFYFTSQNWFLKLPLIQQQLITTSFILLDEAKQRSTIFFDYSYILTPAAKAYEGFIKDLVFSLNLIAEKRYLGKRFRVGRALNPEYAKDDPDGFEALYDDLTKLCGGEMIASQLWNTWLECRNRVFHYFVNKQATWNIFEVEERLNMIIKTIEEASINCHLPVNS